MTFKPVVVDVSHWNTVHDWTAVKTGGIEGVILKATESVGGIDPKHALWSAQVKDAGLMRGHYHFLRAGNGAGQADHFLSVAQPEAGDLVALDYEVREVGINDALAFLHRVEEKLGRKAVFYLGGADRFRVDPHDAYLAAHRLWHPQYGPVARIPKPWNKYWLWQYTGDGLGPAPHSVPGIAQGKGTDLSIYDGTPEQLAQEWAK